MGLVMVGVFVSCAPTMDSSFAPVTDRSGEPVVLKPSKFTVGKSTRKSDVMRLSEDVVNSMPENFPSNLVRLDPDKGEVVAGALLMISADVQEKGKSSRTGVLIPMAAIKYMNVPQERIDAAIPSIQRAYYNHTA